MPEGIVNWVVSVVPQFLSGFIFWILLLICGVVVALYEDFLDQCTVDFLSVFFLAYLFPEIWPGVLERNRLFSYGGGGI